MSRNTTSRLPLAILFTVYNLILACQGLDSSSIQYNGGTNPSDIRLGEFSSVEDTVQKFGRMKRQSPTDQQVNITRDITVDHHDYYTSRFIEQASEADSYWFELSSLIGSGVEVQDENVVESIIQGFHRYYEVWDLKFNFPFYGHFIDRVAVTTGGFIYTGTFYHDQVHLTQFIAPLQADFNPTLGDDSRILIYSSEDRFTAQWDQVHNHDHEDEGPFTFQVSLFPNGSIYFVYKEIPLLVYQLDNDDHPVEVGLADAFYYDVFQSFFRIRYIYEYSRIQLNASSNLNDAAYIIHPLLNCVIGNNCSRCSELTRQSSFECTWCPGINRCSDGLDRFSQAWIDNDCNEQGISQCPTSTIRTTTTTISSSVSSSPSVASSSSLTSSSSSSSLTSSSLISTTVVISSIIISFTPSVRPSPVIRHASSLSPATISGVVIIILIVALLMVGVTVLACIARYGYTHPQSRVGLFMIEHRPKARSLNRTAKYEMKTDRILLN